MFTDFNILLLFKCPKMWYTGVASSRAHSYHRKDHLLTMTGQATIGQNIKRLRTERQLTQKALAEKLFVTAQAVSRWENGEVEPSVSTISEIARIFGVSADEILGIQTEKRAPEQPQEQAPPIHIIYNEYTEPQRPVLGVCEKCNQPIYDGKNLIRNDSHILCRKCQNAILQQQKALQIERGHTRRKRSILFGAILAALLLITGIVVAAVNQRPSCIIWFLAAAILGFTLLSCCILNNNFIGDMVLSIFEFGFIKFPGVIFSWDLDGIIWLITIKLSFWLLSVVLACATGALAILIGGIVSLFVYPFALRKNILHPDAE